MYSGIFQSKCGCT